MSQFAAQQFLHDPETGVLGDCWRASIASVVGCPIDDVPHFVRDYPQREGDETARWFDETCRWLTQNYGVTALFYDKPHAVRGEFRTEISAFAHIVIDGISPRFDLHHCVVGDAVTGEIVHDPHPDGTGLREVTGAFVLVREVPGG